MPILPNSDARSQSHLLVHGLRTIDNEAICLVFICKYGDIPLKLYRQIEILLEIEISYMEKFPETTRKSKQNKDRRRMISAYPPAKGGARLIGMLYSIQK
jgi:hypothetical protein